MSALTRQLFCYTRNSVQGHSTLRIF